MLNFIQDKTEEFFDDFAYNGRRSVSYILGKSGITAIAPSIVATSAGESFAAMGGSLLAGAGDASTKALMIATPLSAVFSATLVQGDFIHRRKRLLEQYRPEIAAWLGNGRKPEEQTVKDLYLAAFGDEKRGIAANPTLREAMTQNAKERNWGVGISIASTTTSTIAAHAAHHEIEHFWQDIFKDNLTVGTTGIETATVLSLGALGFMIYQAIKTPLHWLAECCFGVEKETYNDKIEQIRRVREAGKAVSQQDVFEAYIQAHPEIDGMVRKEYGRRFARLHPVDKAAVLERIGPQLRLPEVTGDINQGFIRPEELAFIAFDQSSGVARRGEPVRREERPDGSLTKLAGKAARLLGYSKKEQQAAEEMIEGLPTPDQLPSYVGIAAQSPDGNTQLSVQALRDDAPGRSASFVQKLGRSRSADGSMSFVEQVEQSRSSEQFIGR